MGLSLGAWALLLTAHFAGIHLKLLQEHVDTGVFEVYRQGRGPHLIAI